MNQDKIWAHFQDPALAGESMFRAQPRYELLARHVETKDKVLNIGVGHGGLERLLIAKGCDVHCLDPSSRSIAAMKAVVGSERAAVGYSHAIPFPDAHFDVVVMSEVLEHLVDDVITSTVKEVRRVLRFGGHFIGTVPADEDLVVNQVVCPHCGGLFHRWGHVRAFSERSLRALLAARFAHAVVSRHYFYEVGVLNWKGRLNAVLKKAALRMGIKGSGETLFFSVNAFE